VGYDIVNTLVYKYIYYIYQNIMYIKILTHLYIGENDACYEISLMWSWNLDELSPVIMLYSSPFAVNEITTRTMSTYIERHCRDDIVVSASVMTIPQDRMIKCRISLNFVVAFKN